MKTIDTWEKDIAQKDDKEVNTLVEALLTLEEWNLLNPDLELVFMVAIRSALRRTLRDLRSDQNYKHISISVA